MRPAVTGAFDEQGNGRIRLLLDESTPNRDKQAPAEAPGMSNAVIPVHPMDRLRCGGGATQPHQFRGKLGKLTHCREAGPPQASPARAIHPGCPTVGPTCGEYRYTLHGVPGWI